MSSLLFFVPSSGFPKTWLCMILYGGLDIRREYLSCTSWQDRYGGLYFRYTFLSDGEDCPHAQRRNRQFPMRPECCGPWHNRNAQPGLLTSVAGCSPRYHSPSPLLCSLGRAIHKSRTWNRPPSYPGGHPASRRFGTVGTQHVLHLQPSVQSCQKPCACLSCRCCVRQGETIPRRRTDRLGIYDG